jgi:YegS/Rv2252/BmrU family lipid kinase
MDISRKIETPPEVALIINLGSRSGAWAAGQAERELARQGVLVRQCSLVRGQAEIVTAAQTAINAGIRVIVVGGGDGTISAVVDLLAFRPDLVLGVLPIGTGNEMAHELGIPVDLPGACRVIAMGNVANIDLAQANGDYFLHTALVGYPALANRAVPSWLKAVVGKAAYLHAVIGSIGKARPFRAYVSAANGSWEVDTVIVAVGNGFLHLPARVLLPFERVSTSGLAVYSPVDTNPITLTKLALSLWVVRRQQPDLLCFLNSDDILIETDPPQAVDLDGERGPNTPLRVRLARGALQVLVPNPNQPPITC